MIGVELKREVAKKSGTTIKDATAVLEQTWKTIRDGLCRDGTVRIDGFGVFTVKSYKARKGLNTRGEQCSRKAYKKIRFASYGDLTASIEDKNIELEELRKNKTKESEE